MAVLLALISGPSSAGQRSIDVQAVDSNVQVDHYWEAVRLPAEASALDAYGVPEQLWAPLAQGALALSGTESLWLRFRLAPYGSLTPPRRLLEIARAGIDRAELFRLEAGELVMQEVAGDDISTAAWPIRGRYPTFAVTPDGWNEVTYLLRVTHRSPVSLSARLVTDDEFSRVQRLEHLFFGAFFGAIGLLVVLATGSLVTTRRPAYGWFKAYALACGICFFAASGQLGEWWYEAPPDWIDAAPYAMAVTSAALGVLYLTSALAFRQFSRMGYGIAVGVGTLGLALGAVTMTLQWPQDRIAAGYVIVALTLVAWLLAKARRKGEGWSRLHLMSLLPFALALVYPLGESMMLVPLPGDIFHLIAAACLIHLAVTYFALSAKVKTLREASMRLQASTTVDPLTGVANVRRLRLRVPGLVARARHYRHQGAVLVVEIMNLNDFRNTGGRQAEEMALVRAADVVRSCIKNIDMVSRVDDAHFAIAVEGPLAEKDAFALASHLVARGLRTHSYPPHLTPLDLRVCIQMVPRLTENLDELIASAQLKLESVRAEDPRRIFLEAAEPEAPRRQLRRKSSIAVPAES